LASHTGDPLAERDLVIARLDHLSITTSWRSSRSAATTRARFATYTTRSPASHASCTSPTVLSYKEAGKTKFLMLPAEEVGAVRAATERFRSAKARLEAEGNAGLAELVERLRRPDRGR
jgi:hypothetical protein